MDLEVVQCLPHLKELLVGAKLRFVGVEDAVVVLLGREPYGFLLFGDELGDERPCLRDHLLELCRLEREELAALPPSS